MEAALWAICAVYLTAVIVRKRLVHPDKCFLWFHRYGDWQVSDYPLMQVRKCMSCGKEQLRIKL